MNKKLHDAALVEIAINQKEEVIKLKFIRESGESISVRLIKIHAFRGEDLILQNIVSRLLIYSCGDISENRLASCLEWVGGLSDCPSWIAEKSKEKWPDMLRKGLLDFVIFEPSAGTHIMAVCERIEVAWL